jgi:hypothetical protein
MNTKNGRMEDEANGSAEELAIEALSFVAGDPVIFNRFLRLTGLELENLRTAAGEPAFLAGVLDFILSDERLVVAFADQSGQPAVRITEARQQLGTTLAMGNGS